MKKRIWTTTNYGISIYPICLLGEVLYYDFYRLYGKNLPTTIAEFKEGINRFASFPGERDKKARIILAKVLKNKSWTKMVLEKTYVLCQDLLDQSKINSTSDLAKKSNQELLRLYQSYNKKFRKMYLYGWLGNTVEGDNNFFSALVEKKLADKLKTLAQTEKVGQYFSILTTLPVDSVRDKERKDFLKLLSKVKNDKNLEKLFVKHAKKYCWLQYDYDGPALGVDYFVTEAKSLIKTKIKPVVELKKITDSQKQLIKEQQRLEKILKLNQEEKYLFWLARQFSFIKNYRKDVLYRSYYENDFLIKEIGRRLSLSLKQVKHILPQEMPEALLNKKYDSALLNQRMKYSVLTFRPKLTVYVGSKAKEIIKNSAKVSALKTSANKLTGQSAYPGKVKGQVRIINLPAEMKDFKKGEILVSDKTNPNLIPAMKKAAAIITNAGGLTCHAAIVSRELKIPCIVGTIFATAVLKNNQKVEVDADRGVVKIL